MIRVFRIALVPLVFIAAEARRSFADELHESFGELAKSIVDVVGDDKIAVGVFSPTGLPDTNSGPGLEVVLRAELDHCKKGCVATKGAKYEVKGDYAFLKDRVPNCIQLTVRLIDIGTNQELVQKRIDPINISGPPAKARILQPNVSLRPSSIPPGDLPPGDGVTQAPESDPTAPPPNPDKLIQTSIEQPSFFLDPRDRTHSFCRNRVDSPYAVQILLVTPQGLRPLPVHDDGGIPYVDIPLGASYAVNIYNYSDKEIAAALTIDGIDSYCFAVDHRADGSPYSHYIIGPKGSRWPDQRPSDVGLIPGWFHSLTPPENYYAFEVTTYGQGEASKLGRQPGAIGVIQVSIADTAFARGGTPDKETIKGRPITVQSVVLDRAYGEPHDFISIRYAR